MMEEQNARERIAIIEKGYEIPANTSKAMERVINYIKENFDVVYIKAEYTPFSGGAEIGVMIHADMYEWTGVVYSQPYFSLRIDSKNIYFMGSQDIAYEEWLRIKEEFDKKETIKYIGE